MSWIRIDDNAPYHPKQLSAGPAACWLWVCGLAYCQRTKTDGHIPTAALALLGVGNWKKLAGFLVSAGLWHKTDTGYQVHDYLTWNSSREERDEQAETNKERLRKWREKKRQRETPLQGGSETPFHPPNETLPTPLHSTPLLKERAASAAGPRVFDRTHANHIFDFCAFMCLSETKVSEFAKLLPRGLSDPENFNRVIAWAEEVRDTWGELEITETKWWDFWEARWKERKASTQSAGDFHSIEETKRRYLS